MVSLHGKVRMMLSFQKAVVLSLFLLGSVSVDGCNIDLGIILDDSTSIGTMGLMDETRFVKDLTRLFTISSSHTRVSVMTYSDDASMKIHFNSREGQDKWKLDFELMGIFHKGGGTKTHLALEMARNQMFKEMNGARPGVPKMLLLLTDGQSQSDKKVLARESNLLHDQFINIMSIGIGNQVRRTELELIASEPTSHHVFLVTGSDILNRVANTIKKEACKVNTCSYFQCIYNQWSSWSGTCHTVSRTKTVRQAIKKSKTMIGGCAGLNVHGCKPITETKTIVHCMRTCNYVECKYGQWSQWSTTCGRGERRRNMQAIRKTTQRVNCNGLPQTCSKVPDIQTRSQKCSCNYVECNYGLWSAWSTSCGRGQRSRSLQTIKKTIELDSCNGLPTTCPTNPTIETRNQKCLCNYVTCNYGSWSAWSTSCGRGQRSRSLQTTKRTIELDSCNGLPTTCPTKPSIETRNQKCLCNYVECKYGPWSAWSTTCGNGQRSRYRQTIHRSIERENCNGLLTRCPTSPNIEIRNKKCTCNYVTCDYGSWSAWSTSCGRGQRSRQMQATKKTIELESCTGLPTTCPTKPSIETRTKMCSCNYVECKNGTWSAWTTSCGIGYRWRQTQAIGKSIQRENCNGLPTKCPANVDIETRNPNCSCNYVECNYGSWSAWSTSCGRGQRSRQMQTTQKSAQRENCKGLPKSCPTSPDVETRNKACSCNYVECKYGTWSAWSTSCGNGQRSRQIQREDKTMQRENCTGLTTSCPKSPELETRAKMCTCNYVECSYAQWSQWSTTCGRGERMRSVDVSRKTIERINCDGLPLLCPSVPEVQNRNKLCECDTVECLQQWSAWSATCGLMKRTLRFVTKPVKVNRESCDGLRTKCPNITESQVDDLPCPKTSPPVITTLPPAFDEACTERFKAIGCVEGDKGLKKLLLRIANAEMHKQSISSDNAGVVWDVLCKCATSAKANGFEKFVVSTQGNCYAGKGIEDRWNRETVLSRDMCLNLNQEGCSTFDEFCIGGEATLFAYEVEI